MAEILSYNPYRDMHNDVKLSAMFFGKNIQNIPFFSSTQTSVKEFDSYGLKVFTFTGKERDSETGYSYFGARYYDSDVLTGWLSVDPMADKYPSLSPYAYCHWNPIILIDPSGESDRKFIDYDTGEFLGEINDGVNETVKITSEDFATLQKLYKFDSDGGDDQYSEYNKMINRFSIGEIGYDIAQTAKKYIGNTDWAYDVKKDNFEKNTHKCNKFIYDVLKECGIDICVNGRAPLAGEWANSSITMDGCSIVVGNPNLGDIIAGSANYNDATGHVSIVTGINLNTGKITTTSAGRSKIREENFGSSILRTMMWGNTRYNKCTVRKVN